MPTAIANIARRSRALSGSFAAGFSAFLSTFRKEYRTSDPLPSFQSLSNFNSYSSYRGRLVRYALYWAFYENTAYDNIHKFAKTFKEEYSLYRSIRGTYNPFHRLGELWATYLYGGNLDDKAGDGLMTPSAMPIVTKNEAVRPVLAKLWRDSNLQVQKSVLGRLGAVMGDVGIRIRDDVENGRVTLDVINPMTIKWVDQDPNGDVIAYIIEEARLDPDAFGDTLDPFFDPNGSHPIVTYTEWCYLDKATGDVTWRTYLDGIPYAWNGEDAEWTHPLGFVPFVLVNHIKTLPEDRWGWAECHSGLTKAMEVDDLGSKLHDQIRRVVEGVWFLAGVQPPKPGAKVRGTTPTEDNPDPDRQDMKIMYGGMGATAAPLMFPLDIQFTSMEIQFLITAMEKDYPELQFDSSRVSGDASGKALREVRKKAEAKVMDRRANYDDHMVRVFQRAIALGGWRGYEGYEGFGLDSMVDGSLDMQIGVRTVFEVDTLDKLEEENARATVVQTYNLSGVPPEWTFRRLGMTDDQIADYMATKQRQDEQAMKMQQATAEAAAKAKAAAAPDGGGGAGGSPPPKAAPGKPVQHDPQSPQAN